MKKGKLTLKESTMAKGKHTFKRTKMVACLPACLLDNVCFCTSLKTSKTNSHALTCRFQPSSNNHLCYNINLARKSRVNTIPDFLLDFLTY